jgi:hypothetical protein
MAVILHDSLTGDILYRRLAGVGKHESDAELERLASAAVDLIFGAADGKESRPTSATTNRTLRR